MFVERLWRSVKYEEVYLRAYDSVSDGPRFDRRLSMLLKGEDPRSEGVDRDVSRPAVIACEPNPA